MTVDLREVPIELESPSAGSQPVTGDGSSPAGALGALAAAAGLVLTIVLLNGLGPDGRRYESFGDGRVRPDAALADGPAAPVISIDPADDLVDSQTLTVTGSGFAAGVDITLTQCVLGLVEPVSNCHQSNVFETLQADARGEFTAQTRARRLLRSDSGILDCAHLTAGRCALVATADRPATPQTTRFGGAVQLRYDRAPEPPALVEPSDPALDDEPVRPPDFRISLEGDTGLRDGERVTVLVADAEPGTLLNFGLCAPDTPPGVDCPPVAAHHVGDERRTWFDIRLPRLTREWASATMVDCAEGCDLRVRTDDTQLDIPVRFDVESDLLPPAVLTLDDTAAARGDPVTVTGSGFLPLTSVDSFVCSRPIQRDEEFWADPVHWCGWPPDGLWTSDLVMREDGTFEASLVQPATIDLFSWNGPHQCHLQDCWLVVTTGRAPGTTPVGSIPLSGDEQL